MHLDGKSLYISYLPKGGFYVFYTINMSVSDEQLDHLAKLAALHLTPDEKLTIGKQVNSIIEFVGKLSEVDVE